MEKIKKENLLESYQELQKEKKTLEEKTYSYKINTPGIGGNLVKNMSKEECIKNYAQLKAEWAAIKETMSELGLSIEEATKIPCRGGKIEDWKEDLKTRIQELKDMERLEKVVSAIFDLEKILSDDEKKTLTIDYLNDLLEN